MSSRLLLVAGFVLLVAGVPPDPAAAQDSDPVYLTVEAGTGGVHVDLAGLLGDRALANAIHQGLPLRISVEAELWKDQMFDSQEAAEDWKASLLYDAVTLQYEVRIQDGAPSRFSMLAEARAHLQSSFGLRLRPSRPGRYYYLAVVEMATLSLSDLEELQRWLNGDLGPAVDGNTDGALGRGVRRLFVRALGLPTRRVRLRTEAFTFEGAGPSG